MKSRFTALDLRASVLELQKELSGVRLQNIYDAQPTGRAFLLKFTKTESKVTVLLESGVRVHRTVFTHEKPNNLPGGFVAKLRKHIRGKRLMRFEQVNFDRVAHFQFGGLGAAENESGCALSQEPLDEDELLRLRDFEFHLYVELYAQGNVILTDWEGKILALLRPLPDANVVMGAVYNPWDGSLDLPSSDALQSLSGSAISLKNTAQLGLSAFSPAMIEHCLAMAGLGKRASSVPADKSSLFVAAALALIEKIHLRDFAGFLRVSSTAATPSQVADLSFPVELVDFSPLQLGASEACIQYPSFSEAVDLFFTRLEAQRAAQKAQSFDEGAKTRLDAIASEQAARMVGLGTAVELCLKKAQAIEHNYELVEDMLKVVKTAVDAGMDWNEFKRLIGAEREQPGRRGEIAKCLIGLKLERGVVTVSLPALEEDAKALDVDVRYHWTVHANASHYYDLRQQARDKLERTQAANAEALKSAAAKIRASSGTRQQKSLATALNANRKPFWFERFAWFSSSDGYLVLAGRDAQQNELLVKRHLRPGDAYVHADIHGAGSIIVKNHCAGRSIPPRALLEAGAFSICQSRAWEAKIVTSAWWVHAEQVSKTAPSGEFLGAGSFMIRGKKNYLPPSQLSLSFGFVFVVGEEERAARRTARLQRENQEQNEQEASDATDLKGFEKYQVESVVQDMDELIIDTTAVPDDRPKSKQKSQKDQKKEKEKGKKGQGKEDVQVVVDEGKSPAKAAANGSARGKHGKAKKMQTKYRDQDDEERALRMQLLASAGKQEPPPKEPVKTRERPVVARKEPKPAAPMTPIEDDAAEEPTEDANPTEFIASDYFISSPLDDHQYAFALPVCFPTSAFSSARFRLKLIPGSVKKGKAVKAAVSILTNAEHCPIGHLKDLMRAVPETEMIAVMPAKIALGVSAHETAKLSSKRRGKGKPKAKAKE